MPNDSDDRAAKGGSLVILTVSDLLDADTLVEVDRLKAALKAWDRKSTLVYVTGAKIDASIIDLPPKAPIKVEG
jgi:hypothetical protein